ncbi:MAG: exo-alpha-sialidase [Rubinisphaera brasiliensis]|uniref:exo-alpha-sialidase n=1 Tax=Rubinisphaera brasiliensis TaxID=119 RepID=UPI00391DD1ED
MLKSLFCCLAALTLCCGLDPQANCQAEEKAELVKVDRIWDKAAHNAFTDLIRYQGRWFCVFREGDAHVSAYGKLRVITSETGQSWKSAALIEQQGADLRDAKITITRENQLMLSGAAAYPSNAKVRHQSMTWFSKDGHNWSAGYDVGDPSVWLWRTTWHRGDAYGFGYGTGSNKGLLRFYRSKSGKEFETWVRDLDISDYPNETALLFTPDEDAHCLLRRDGADSTALLGRAEPPYRDWKWKNLGVRVGGPAMLQLPDERVVAAVRLYDGGARTSLCWVDLENGKLTEFLELPSGGDTSYAGLVWHQDRLWVSYYSGHEADGSDFKTAIYLAQVQLPKK